MGVIYDFALQQKLSRDFEFFLKPKCIFYGSFLEVLDYQRSIFNARRRLSLVVERFFFRMIQFKYLVQIEIMIKVKIVLEAYIHSMLDIHFVFSL